MNSDFPYWYKLIKRLNAEHLITLGPTIPYIVGAYEINDAEDSMTIHDLLYEILNSETDEVALIQKCPDIGKHIIYLKDRNFCTRFMQKEISFHNKKREKRLFVTQNALGLGATLEDVIQSLNNEYEKYIKEHKFSWDKNKLSWTEFTEEQKDFIKSIG